jgi:LPXTG-motif cell wall-anchored protein
MSFTQTNTSWGDLVRISVLARIGGVATLAAMIAFGGAPAWADSTIDIDPADVGQTAAQFPVHRCDPRFGGGPFAGDDVWVFALPRPKAQGDFQTVTIEFATEGGPVTETITHEPAMDRAIVDGRAWIRTSAGLSADGQLLDPRSIISATAVITGSDGTFDLAQTCPATGGALPVTGPEMSGSLGRIAGLGGALTLAGLGLVLVRRRRRTVA